MKQTEAETQYAAIKKSYDELKVAFGDKTPEQITKEITDMKTANTDLTAKVAALDKEVAELKTVNDTLTAQRKDAEEKLATQAQGDRSLPKKHHAKKNPRPGARGERRLGLLRAEHRRTARALRRTKS